MKRWAVIGAIAVVGLYLLWVFLVMQEVPTQMYPRADAPFVDDRFAAATIDAPDGAQIPVAIRKTDGAPVVLYFMGNAGSRALHSPDLELLLSAPVSVVVMSYRGSEGSTLEPSEAALKGDARALYAQLPDVLGYGPLLVHVVGYSMGSGLALDLAAREDLTSVVLKAPMPRICAMIASHTMVPVCLLPGDHWDNFALARQVEEPVFIAYGEKDEMFSTDDVEALARNLPKPHHTARYPDASHNDFSGTAFGDDLLAWLSRPWQPVAHP